MAPSVIQIEHTETLVPTSEYKLAKWDFDEFNPIQSKLNEIYEGNSNIAIAAATSAGKAQPMDADVLMPQGFVKMGSVQLGQKIASSNGGFSEVVGVFPQGKKLVYRITFSDGASVDCCADHLWSVRTRHDKCRKRPFRVKELKDLLGDLKLKDGQNKWSVPLIDIDFSYNKYQSEFLLHPYVLGVLLGDGGIKHRIILSSVDEWIINEVDSLLPDNVLIEQIEGCDYQIVGGMEKEGAKRGFKKTNLVKQILKDLDLFGLGSCEKFIPESYLYASNISRLSLLMGLMDSDGNSNGENHAAEFSSCSKKLADGVCQLARSFGASTNVRVGESSYKDKDGNVIECHKRYRVTVNLGEINPFGIPRKSCNQGLRLEKGRNRFIESVEEIGQKECQCISVSAEDNLYVTNDYVLTHNTVCAEMFMAYEIKKRKGKTIYVGPMKALAKEKEADWTSDEHHFSEQNVSIVTGDFRLTKKRIDELEKANIIVMTPEMMASRCRNSTSDKSEFLKEVGTVVFDESHLLTVPGRGDHIEVALMKMVEINPDVRIVLLSATMPNVDEICDWISQITNRDTHYLESDFRPCPLHVHYESYYDGDRKYDEREGQKINQAMSIIEDYPDDKFLVFVHTKMTGRNMVTALKSCGIEAQFHNADLNLKQRLDVENKFKGKGLRVIVATSTLAWGMNLPARRVIVTGVHRGLDVVENYDIQQMVGRAGRPRFDPVGDAYILVPESEKSFWTAKLRKKSKIKSTLLKYVGNEENPHYKTLAFHVVSEIHYGNIKTREGFKEWFKDSLAHYQDVGFDDEVLDKTINLLAQYRAIRVDENDEFHCTPLGMIASLYYYSPFDVSDFRRNFHFLFDKNQDGNDFAIAMAMGNVDSHRWGIVSRYEREQMSSFEVKVKKMFGENSFTSSAVKVGYAYYNMLRGKNDVPAFAAMQGALRADLDRTMQVVRSIDSMSSHWGRKEWLDTLRLRLLYGVSPELVQLCQIPNIGQVRAKRLVAKNIHTVDDFTAFDPSAIAKIVKCSPKLAGESLEAARMIQLKSSIN